jgi:Fe-S-cluster containining protein
MTTKKDFSQDLEMLFKQAMDRFECTQCGTCCRGEGGIYLTQEETSRISLFLNLSAREFIENFCLNKNGRTYIHIREDGFCHFSREGKCAIHPVKPAPCRKWPFFTPMLTSQANWEAARNSCPALAPYRTLADFLEGKATA